MTLPDPTTVRWHELRAREEELLEEIIHAPSWSVSASEASDELRGVRYSIAAIEETWMSAEGSASSVPVVPPSPPETGR